MNHTGFVPLFFVWRAGRRAALTCVVNGYRGVDAERFTSLEMVSSNLTIARVRYQLIVTIVKGSGAVGGT